MIRFRLAIVHYLLSLTPFHVIVNAFIPLRDEVDFPMGIRHNDEFYSRKFKDKTVAPKTVGSFRLPNSIIPLHYDLEVRPILEEDTDSNEEIFTCPGKVVIRCHVIKPTQSITLHAKNISIDHRKIRVTRVTNFSKELEIMGFYHDSERSLYTVFLEETLPATVNFIIKIPFRSWIVNPERLQAGLYRTSYLGSDGLLKIGAVTQFQKNDASRAFPCFDEPGMKATFTIKIGRPQGDWMSFSNMERNGNATPIEGLSTWVWDTYHKTNINISTYLVAFAVLQDYEAEETPEALSRRPMKTWIPKALKLNSTVKTAAEISGPLLTCFEELFEIPYYFDKLENIGYENVELYAMEHPGLVTFRTSVLARDKTINTQWDEFNQVSIISHEYSHQWVGNLVTCHWWNDFWLNEAFARYFQYIGAEKVRPDFRVIDRTVIDVTQWAMQFDESSDTVPIHSSDTEKVSYKPFPIEYEKGAAIIRMLQTILTKPTFMRGIRRFLKSHMHRNVGPEDLYEALTEQALEDETLPEIEISNILKAWITTTGFPILQVSKADHNHLYITQQRFVSHNSPNDKMEAGLWHVPIWIITKANPYFDGDNTRPHFWMEKDQFTMYHLINTTEEWIILNPQGRGYYRVVYDHTLTELISKQLQEDHLVFDAPTRSQLFDNYFRSARARYITLGHALMLTNYLHKENDIIVWTTILNNYRRVFQRLRDTPLIGGFKEYLLFHLRPAVHRLGIILRENPPPSNILLNSLFVDWLCMFEDDACKKLVAYYMDKWMGKPSENPIPVDIQPSVYCAAVAFDDTGKMRQFIHEQIQNPKNFPKRNWLLRALTCCKDTNYLTRLVEGTVDVNNSLPIDIGDDGSYVLWHVVRNPPGLPIVWKFLKESYDEIQAKMGHSAIASLIEAVAPYMSNKGSSKLNYEFMGFVQTYLKMHNHVITSNMKERLTKAATVIVENSLWMDYFYNELRDFLVNNNYMTD